MSLPINDEGLLKLDPKDIKNFETGEPFESTLTFPKRNSTKEEGGIKCQVLFTQKEKSHERRAQVRVSKKSEPIWVLISKKPGKTLKTQLSYEVDKVYDLSDAD